MCSHVPDKGEQMVHYYSYFSNVSRGKRKKADTVFSAADTINWYEAHSAHYKRQTKDFACLFLIPGMAHCSGDPACDRFKLFDALIDLVEKGIEPDEVESKVNPGNTEVPADWSSDRTRPLCAYPTVPMYQGGDINDASSFACVTP